MRTPIAIALLLAATAALAQPAKTDEWKLEGNVDVLRPAGLRYEYSSGTIPGTSVTVRWDSGAFGCWGAKDYLGTEKLAKKNLVYKKVEITSGPSCTSNGGLEICSVSGTGKTPYDGEVAFQVTIASADDRCGTLQTVSGPPNQMAQQAALLATLRAGFARAHTRSAVKPTPTPTPVALKPTPSPTSAPVENEEDDSDELDPGAGPWIAPFDQKSVPDLKRKLPGACREMKIDDGMPSAWRTTSTWDGERLKSRRTEWESGLGEPLFTLVEHTYDDKGRRIRSTTTGRDGLERTTSISYDAAGRMAKETITQAGLEGSSTIEFSYDAAGRKVKTTESDSTGGKPRVTTYAYDAKGRAVKEGDLLITWSADGRTRTRVRPPEDAGDSEWKEVQTLDAYGNVLHQTSGRSKLQGSETRFDYSCWVK